MSVRSYKALITVSDVINFDHLNHNTVTVAVYVNMSS